jgi:membrane associated rhomboid family serine protease
MTDPGSLYGRALAALVDPAAPGAAMLVASQGPLSVLEWAQAGKGLVLVEHRSGDHGLNELRAAVHRIIGAHQGGLLIVGVVGGGAEVQTVLKEADEAARDRDRLGVYHLGDDERLVRVAGRRLPEFEAAAGHVDRVQPLRPEDMAAVIERGQAQRADAAAFAKSLSRGLPRLTFVLIAVCVFIAALAERQPLTARFSLDVQAIERGEVWRLFTYAFLHGGTAHLVMNMFSLYSLGSFLENLLGGRRFLTVYVLSALVGGLTSAAVALLHPRVSVGASGAIWGLMGATLGLVLRRDGVLPTLVARGLKQRLVVVVLLNIAISMLPAVDFGAHLGGGVVGFVLGRWFLNLRRPSARSA